LLSPEQAAAYLGLRSRFAVYRLVASGQIPALRLANKLRIDLQDLELLIERRELERNGSRGGGSEWPIARDLARRWSSPFRSSPPRS